MNGASSNVPSGAATFHDSVELTLPLHPRHASTARAVAASLAADAGFDVDAIDDLRLAVDEAVSVLLDAARPDQAGSRLVVRFETGTHTVTVSVGCVPRSPVSATADLDELAVRILTAVVDHFDVVDGALVITKRTAPRDGA